ncbi:MAG: cohesin domain-containing protein [Halobacteriota archaeon]
MKKNKCSKLVLVAIATVLASALVLPVFAANEHVIIGITSVSAAPGDTATVPIIVYNVTDLAAGTLSVTYNSSVCTVTDVTAGDLSMLSKNISVPGIVIISALATSGHTGTVSFANIVLKAIGSGGDSTQLNVTVETLGSYTGMQNIPATVINGTFTIFSGPAPPPSLSPPAPVTSTTPSHAPSPYLSTTPPNFEAFWDIAGLFSVSFLALRRRNARR